MDNEMKFFPKGCSACATPYAKIIIEVEALKLKDLIMQTAACVIQECQTMPIQRRSPVVGAGSILANSEIRQYDSPEGSVNALQSQVAFLYEFVKLECTRKSTILTKEERKFIACALSEYQHLKTTICREEEKEHGKGWGSATGFYRANWEDWNEEFLALPTKA